MEGTFKKIKSLLVVGVLLFAVFGILPATAQAATLYFSPSSGSHAVGTTLTVSIYVSSVDQAMNAASGVVSFPTDKLEITSLSKSGSIFTLWVQEPSFSNSAGTVNFEGIVLNPGFTGSSGKAITITFRAKAAGNAPLTFSSGFALANDGKGTNILTNFGKAEFSLGGVAPKVSSVPLAPVISSPTHPDSNKWYANKNPKFEWVLPADVNGVNVFADRASHTNPGIKSDGLRNSHTYKDVDEGVWYFHLRFRNASGWGEVSHFRFQIDTQPPEPFIIKFIDGNETENPRPTVVFDTADSLSGLDYYKIKIGEGDFFSVAPEIMKSNPYTLPAQAPGKRSILVQAFDKAGNYAVAAEDFTIKPLPTPVFAECPQKLQISFRSVVVPLVALIFILLFIIWYGWHKFASFRKKLKNLRKEVSEAESALHKAFDMLKEDIREQVKLLEKTRTKRQLTEEEEKVIKRLRKDLDDAEKFVKKEIEDIEKAVR